MVIAHLCVNKLTYAMALVYDSGEWVNDKRGDSKAITRLTSTDNISNFYTSS